MLSESLDKTPWLCAYCPVSMVAREGQQSGNVAKNRSNVIPLPASLRAAFGITRIDHSSWSSSMITTTFGLSDGGLAEPLVRWQKCWGCAGRE